MNAKGKTLPEYLAERVEIEERATPGPWTQAERTFGTALLRPIAGGDVGDKGYLALALRRGDVVQAEVAYAPCKAAYVSYSKEQTAANAAFIADARNNAAILHQQLREAMALLERLRPHLTEFCEDWCDGSECRTCGSKERIAEITAFLDGGSLPKGDKNVCV